MTLSPIYFRVVIGPLNVAEDDPTDYGHWNWIAEMDTGSPPPVIPREGVWTLAASMGSGSATINLTGGALPSGGGFWVGPNAVGERWEYMPFIATGGVGGTVFVERNPDEATAHTAGAKVYMWYPLDNNNGAVQYDEELSESMNAITWTAKISGVMAPVDILKPEHIIMVVVIRPMVDGESEWERMFVGLVERVQMSQDLNMAGTWELDVVSTSRILQQSSVPALRLGEMDVALQASAEASSSLGANWKLMLAQQEEVILGMRPEIDLIEFQADCEPSNMLDGKDNTLLVSDGWVGSRGAYINSQNKRAWASLFVYPPPMDWYGSKYIEIIHTDNMTSTWLWTYAEWTTPTGVRKRWFQGGNSDTFAKYGGMDDDSLDDAEDRLIIAEDADVFKRIFPSANPKVLLDASTLAMESTGTDIELIRRLWWEKGAIFLRWRSESPFFEGRDSLISWGNVTYAQLQAEWAISGDTNFTLPGLDFNIPTGYQPGKVFRRDMTQAGANSHNYYVDWIHAPGYVITDTLQDDDREHSEFVHEWFKITLPTMSHVLKDDINPGDTVIKVIDAQGNPNVEGLSRNDLLGMTTFYVIIDTEIISYTGKDYYEGTLTGCTVGSKHRAGAKVYVQWQVKSYGRGNAFNYSAIPTGMRIPAEDATIKMASDCYPLSRLRWGRGKFADGTDRHPYMGDFTWWFSLEENPPTIEENFFRNGYFNTIIDSADTTHFPTISAPNASADLTSAFFQEVSDEGFRPRTLMCHIRKMKKGDGTVITARPMLNYVECIVDPRYFNPDTYLDTVLGGYDNEAQIMALMQLSGHYGNFFIHEPTAGFGRIARKIGTTERGICWQIASDMADYGTSILVSRMDGKIGIRINRFLNEATHTPIRSFSETFINSLEIVNVRPQEVAQVRLTWEDPNTGNGGTALYPSKANTRFGGAVLEMGPMLADNQAGAELLATNLYKSKRFTYNVFVELRDSDDHFDIHAADIHSLQYDFLRNGQSFVKQLLVESVSQTIANGFLKTQVGYREIDRDTY